ncbi:MAG: hypothetical protein QOI35_4025, partial [Cryptosporangiaceae bacterium]|nr:hypothetical protein [Cryptosporangiaceae bacterium]
GTSDLVLCGGADLHNGAHDFLLFSSVHALSPTGKCRPFDSTADGIALGEGVACVVLKRLADAERDGDRVYAVIRSVAGSSDGRSLGLTAPRPDGQRRALERAYERAGISPAAVGLVEAHGTGTVVGDRTELKTLTEVFAEAGADPASCSLGSVKSQIGHTKCAAGMAGLFKAARALHTGVRPPTLHVSAPNQFWDRGASPFYFDSAAQPWTTPPAQRIAGVSAFGFGGTNFHAVLSGYAGAPEPAHGLDEWPAELFLFRGADRQGAESSMDALAALLDAGETAGRPWRLRDLAATTCGTGSQPVWAAIVATGLDDLGRKLALARNGGTGEGVFTADPAEGQVAFLFPGQGSQRPGMLADLFVAFPRLQKYLHADGVPAARMYPPATKDPAEQSRQRSELTDTRVAQPALGAAGLAVHELLTSAGVRPDLAGGHSYGELVALCAAGALRGDELAGLSVARGTAILGAAGSDPGAMAAVTTGPERVQAVLDGDPACAGVVVANRNAPEQTVISGPSEALGVAADRLAADGLAVTRIPVACAFHSPLVAAAAGTLAAELATRTVGVPAFPVWSNSTATPYGADPQAVRDTLARQVADPVRFTEQIESMYAAGARIFVEAGPGRVLTGLTRRILGDRPHRAIAVDVPGEPGLPRFLHALAELAVAGASVDPSVLFAGRDARLVSVREVPRRPGWIVDGHTVRTAAGEYLPNGLRPATRVTLPNSYVPSAVEAAMSPSPSGALPARDHAVLEYLRGTRELIAAQRDVLLGYLGSAAPAPQFAAPATQFAAAGQPFAVTGQQFGGPATVELVSAAPVVAAVAEAPPETGPASAEDVLAAVLAVVSERTGYPPDMLDPDLDLEADLSIDSIKRTEILAELTSRIALPGTGGNALDDSAVEALARIKTLRGIVAWITDPPQVETLPIEPLPVAVRRHVVRMSALPALPPASTAGFGGHRFVLVEDAMSVGLELADLLRQRGGDVQMVPAGAGPDAVAGAGTVVHLAALDRTGQPILPASFATLRAAVLGGARRVLLVTCAGGQLGHGRITDPATAATGAGLPGLARALAREFPGVRISAADVDPKQEPERIALALLAELDAPDGPPVVGLTAAGRVTATVEPLELGHGTDLPTAASLGLTPASVLLLTGGARGITAQTALALARTAGCHIELIGRTPEPSEPEDPSTAGAADPVALRRALIATGVRTPAEVEAATQRLLAERAVRSTLDGLREAAASVRYHVADVRDAATVEAIVAGIYTRHGRLDGVVHGAGVLDDKLLADKTPESFASVYGTKVDGARALVAALRPDCGFLVLFGSVSGVFGNRGQCDYSAANDSLDLLARIWAPRFTGRVVAVDWGPWAPAAGGMVSEELEREYARRGVELIGTGEGVGCLLRELAWGGREPQVVYVAGDATAVGGDA